MGLRWLTFCFYPGNDFGNIDFSNLGGGDTNADDDDESDDDMPPLEGEEEEEKKDQKVEDMAVDAKEVVTSSS